MSGADTDTINSAPAAADGPVRELPVGRRRRRADMAGDAGGSAGGPHESGRNYAAMAASPAKEVDHASWCGLRPEVTRLARTSTDWQHLIEMCRVVDTVLQPRRQRRLICRRFLLFCIGLPVISDC